MVLSWCIWVLKVVDTPFILNEQQSQSWGSIKSWVLSKWWANYTRQIHWVLVRSLRCGRKSERFMVIVGCESTKRPNFRGCFELIHIPMNEAVGFHVQK
jgi:hypothetical protein